MLPCKFPMAVWQNHNCHSAQASTEVSTLENISQNLPKCAIDSVNQYCLLSFFKKLEPNLKNRIKTQMMPRKKQSAKARKKEWEKSDTEQESYESEPEFDDDEELEDD